MGWRIWPPPSYTIGVRYLTLYGLNVFLCWVSLLHLPSQECFLIIVGNHRWKSSSTDKWCHKRFLKFIALFYQFTIWSSMNRYLCSWTFNHREYHPPCRLRKFRERNELTWKMQTKNAKLFHVKFCKIRRKKKCLSFLSRERNLIFVSGHKNGHGVKHSPTTLTLRVKWAVLKGWRIT